MKQKENIFEELNKMRSLIHTRAGVVISEQANAGADVGTVMRELDNFNSDEAKIVNIIKKYKDKASFKAFTDQYKTISGKDFGADVFRAIQPYNDKAEWNDLKNHLSTMGVTLGNATTNGGRGGTATFTGLDTPVTTKTQQSAAKTGIKKPIGNKSNNYSKIVGDYSKQIQTSLGSSPTGKMSSQDLDLILKKLNGEDVSVEVSQELPTDTNGKPDLDKIKIKIIKNIKWDF